MYRAMGPFRLLLLALTVLFVVSHAVSAQQMCGDIVLLGTQEEIAATPREHSASERLALLMGGGFTADQAVYERVHEETRLIRELYPEVSHIYAPLDYLSFRFILGYDPAVDPHEYTGWDCLNSWYRIEVDYYYRYVPAVVMQSEGMYDLDALFSQYAQLPEVKSLEKDYVYTLGEPEPFICGVLGNPSNHYFYGSSECSAWCRYFKVSPGSAPELVGTSSPGGAWWCVLQRFCNSGPSPSSLAVDPPSPSPASPVVITASKLVSNSACAPIYQNHAVDTQQGIIRINASISAYCGGFETGGVEHELEVPVGALPAGDYTVVYISSNEVSGEEQLEAVADFSVRVAQQQQNPIPVLSFESLLLLVGLIAAAGFVAARLQH